MARVSFGMQMATYTRATGRTIRLTAMVFISMRTEPVTWESGETISKTAMVSRPGQMEVSIRASTSMGKNTVKESTSGSTAPSTPDPGPITRSVDLELIGGPMAASMKVNG